MKKTKHKYDVTLIENVTCPISEDLFSTWVQVALESENQTCHSVNIIVVGKEQSADINKKFRGKLGPTNILSFNCQNEFDDFLGELYICASIVSEQAKNENKPETAHWAHLTIHGVLHLLGYNHEDDDEANLMETKEIAILQRLNFQNPYMESIS